METGSTWNIRNARLARALLLAPDLE